MEEKKSSVLCLQQVIQPPTWRLDSLLTSVQKSIMAPDGQQCYTTLCQPARSLTPLSSAGKLLKTSFYCLKLNHSWLSVCRALTTGHSEDSLSDGVCVCVCVCVCVFIRPHSVQQLTVWTQVSCWCFNGFWATSTPRGEKTCCVSLATDSRCKILQCLLTVSIRLSI